MTVNNMMRDFPKVSSCGDPHDYYEAVEIWKRKWLGEPVEEP